MAGTRNPTDTQTYTLTDTEICIRKCVCLCVCVFVCMYVCMYVCVYICMYVCMRIRTNSGKERKIHESKFRKPIEENGRSVLTTARNVSFTGANLYTRFNQRTKVRGRDLAKKKSSQKNKDNTEMRRACIRFVYSNPSRWFSSLLCVSRG